MPVFPLVASIRIVSPGVISPLDSAPSMRLLAILSLIEEHGSNDSNFKTIFATTPLSLVHDVKFLNTKIEKILEGCRYTFPIYQDARRA